MCLNGWGGKLHEALADFVSSDPPDILCLQEVVHSPSTDLEWLTYKDGAHSLLQRANFFADVRTVLPDHAAIFCPAARGELWDGDLQVPSHWGLATFVRNSLPLVGQSQGFVHKSYSPSGYGDHPRPRSAHTIRVYDHQRDRAVTIAHMHGLRDLNGKADTLERDTQARRLLLQYQQVAQPGDLGVICGDFNVEVDSETLQYFENAGFTELVTKRGFAGTRTSHYGKPGRFADYMLVNSEESVLGFDVVYSPEVSDHCPMILQV